MSRKIINVPTSLSDTEVWAKISMFLFENGFKKTKLFGEDIFEKEPSLAQYFLTSRRHSYYFKILFDNGILHLEAFRRLKGWETPIDGGTYGRDLLMKLQPVLTEIGSNQSGSGYFAEKPQQTPVYRQPVPNQQYAPPQKQFKQTKRKNGLAVASLILGILTIPAIPFIVPSFLIGFVGFVLGLISLLEKKDGKGMAVTGIVLNILGIGLEILFILYILSLRQI